MSKRDHLASYLDDCDCDVLVLTETWLHPDIYDSEIASLADTHNIYRCDCTKKRGGGVLLAIKKKTIISHVINTNSELEVVWAACLSSTTKVLFGFCYRPPDSTKCFVNELWSSIDKATELCLTKFTYLLGDFNFPLIDWSQLSSSCRLSTEFIDLTVNFNLCQVVHLPTRGNNLLDLILTNAPETIGQITHLDGFSDHNLLQTTINVPFQFAGVETKPYAIIAKETMLKLTKSLTPS